MCLDPNSWLSRFKMTPEAWRATGVAAVLLAKIVAGDSLVATTYETTDGLMAYMSSSTSQYLLIVRNSRFLQHTNFQMVWIFRNPARWSQNYPRCRPPRKQQ